MITAILLAAGSSRRMGKENKLTLAFKGKPMIAHMVDEILASQPDELIVVTGYESSEISAWLKDKQVKIVFNPHHLKGMTTSIQAGVMAAHEHSSGFMICLGDQPLILAKEYNLLINHFLEEKSFNTRQILVPVFEGKRGNPVIFSSFYRNEILQHQQMEGCREIILRNQPYVRPITVETPHILKDIDTPEDYDQL